MGNLNSDSVLLVWNLDDLSEKTLYNSAEYLPGFTSRANLVVSEN